LRQRRRTLRARGRPPMTTRTTTEATTEATAETTTGSEPLQVREIVPFQSVRVAENQTWRGFGAVRRPAALLVVLGAVVFGAVGGGARSGAAAPSRQGWWKVGLPIAQAGIGGLGTPKDPQGADVADGGLLVQGRP